MTRRVEKSRAEHINTSSNAVWNTLNDQFCEALKSGNYQPQVAIDKINELLLSHININAKNSQGRTLLAIARYHEVPNVLVDIIQKHGGE